jgi:hypothetical protein
MVEIFQPFSKIGLGLEPALLGNRLVDKSLKNTLYLLPMKNQMLHLFTNPFFSVHIVIHDIHHK